MLEKIISLDQEAFIFLNGLGSETYDGFWLIITKQTSWIPFFLFLFYIIFRKLGIKQALFLLLFVTLLVILTDQTANVFKNGFQRLRPCNNPEINSFIRIVQSRTSYSFFSGHAANSMGVATFLYLIFKKDFNSFWLLFLWPLMFAYSRIYLGLHYPLDIISGYLCGAILGFLMFKLYRTAQQKYFAG
ncbi:phosphatase PAP2 family protein [Flavobacterium nackdongense]|uniref:Phosphatase PAP2 family protein n=1 Tax=Flavobacterium nackdongense TaxID=2547394 RepID=A0A4P6Y7U7_9FLAO|nr:phosphatase PAP2 family protein [Flavobacterium nackdongense]QBN18789.1 phosphatase PAP2 family protein [Flavobacterium nackdongense]